MCSLLSVQRSDVVLVQVGEEQLAAEAVVVADPVAGDREAEQPVEAAMAYCTSRAWGTPSASSSHGLPEGGEVAAQLLEAVHPERHPLLDHERVERQVAVAVGAVVDQVPQHERALGQRPGRATSRCGVRGQLAGRGSARRRR